MKQQLIASKKVYCIDNGICEAIAFSFSKNRGSFLENTVFMALKRSRKEIYYYITKKGKELDFLVKEGTDVYRLIQVCAEFGEENTRQRELAALARACDELNLDNALIITENEKENLTIGNKTIYVLPCYEWLLSDGYIL